ncbi:hypothetical protein ACIOML_35615 [Streptomyces anulatus]
MRSSAAQEDDRHSWLVDLSGAVLRTLRCSALRGTTTTSTMSPAQRELVVLRSSPALWATATKGGGLPGLAVLKLRSSVVPKGDRHAFDHAAIHGKTMLRSSATPEGDRHTCSVQVLGGTAEP